MPQAMEVEVELHQPPRAQPAQTGARPRHQPPTGMDQNTNRERTNVISETIFEEPPAPPRPTTSAAAVQTSPDRLAPNFTPLQPAQNPPVDEVRLEITKEFEKAIRTSELLAPPIVELANKWAEWDNVMRIRDNHVNQLTDGYPPITPMGKPIQIPSARRIDMIRKTELFNDCMKRCADECSRILIQIEEEILLQIKSEIQILWSSRDWSREELATVSQLRHKKARPRSFYVSGRRAPVVFFAAPDEKQPFLIKPHESAKKAHVTSGKRKAKKQVTSNPSNRGNPTKKQKVVHNQNNQPAKFDVPRLRAPPKNPGGRGRGQKRPRGTRGGGRGGRGRGKPRGSSNRRN